jgi:putative mRNA 3-end processing factor
MGITMKRIQTTRMNATHQIDVLKDGTVLLGPDITCDGHHSDRHLRVQTHIHSDHMAGWGKSLRQEVLMSFPTLQLLMAQSPREHETLDLRSNLYVAIENFKDAGIPDLQCHTSNKLVPMEMDFNGNKVELISSDHMLGAVQTKVTLSDGTTVGYSGDFNWPLEKVMQVDELVVDATYGNPDQALHRPIEEVEQAFVKLVKDGIREGEPVHVTGHTGPIQHALEALKRDGVFDTGDIFVVADNVSCSLTKVYAHAGRDVPELLNSGENETRTRMAEDPCYIRIWSKIPNDVVNAGTLIRLTRMRTDNEAFVQENHSSIGFGLSKIYKVALSNHADYQGTRAYIEQTGAKYVVTNNRRHNSPARIKPAHRLAKALDASGIKAVCRPS